MIMTEDVYRFSAAVDFNFSTTYLVERMETKAKLYGYDVGIINERVNETIGTELMVASRGMNYYAGMEPGDVIIVNDEVGVAHIYTLENVRPACFADTGWTVKFEQEPPQTVTMNATIHDGPYRIEPEVDTSFWERIFRSSDYEFVGYADQLEHLTRAAATTSPLDVNWDAILATIQQGAPAERRPQKKQRLKTPKLSPEDTKELDDFLSSFVTKSAT